MAAEMVAAPRDSESGRELPGCRARLPGCAELVGAYTYQWAVELVY